MQGKAAGPGEKLTGRNEEAGRASGASGYLEGDMEKAEGSGP